MAEISRETTPEPPQSALTQGSSQTGHSFVSTYQDCPRKWYLRYELGIVPKYTAKALTFGIAWHKAIEVFYGGADVPGALRAGLDVLEQAAATDRYQYTDDYEADHARFTPMFETWAACVGREVLARYDVLSLEDTLAVELPSGFTYTGRLDELLAERETGAVFIAEHKSTSFSLPEMERSVFVGDQVAGYVALVRAKRPDIAPKLGGCLLDVTYQRGSKVEARLSRLYYDETDTARLLLNVNGILTELSQKIAAVRSGVCDATLFPRNGGACTRFKCAYEPICRRFIDRDSDLPDTLERTASDLRYDANEDTGA